MFKGRKMDTQFLLKEVAHYKEAMSLAEKVKHLRNIAYNALGGRPKQKVEATYDKSQRELEYELRCWIMQVDFESFNKKMEQRALAHIANLAQVLATKLFQRLEAQNQNKKENK